MISLEVSGFDAIQKRMDSMRETISHFKSVDLGNVMSNWQTKDLHRERPFTMRSRRAGRAATKVRPHSLYEVQRSRKFERYLKRHHRPPRTWSTRPILRGEMLSVLWQEFKAAVDEKIHW